MRVAVAALLLLGGCVAAPAPEPVVPAPVVAPVPPAPPGRFAWEGAAIQGGLVTGTAPAGTRTLTLDGVSVPLDGRDFVIGFDRDARAEAVLAATLADGRTVTERLAVAPRAWRIERVDAPYRAGSTDAAFAARRPAELAAIAAALATKTGAAGWRQHFAWPATGRISGLFGAQRLYRGIPGSYHGGTDIALPAGTPVAAPADGAVVLAADHPFTLEGNLVMIDHGMGVVSAFLHLSRIDVRVGDEVRQGQRIGAVGATGRATGPHLHWGLRWGAARLDPLLVAGPMPD